MNVKRYTHDRSSYRPSFMDEQSDGDYVLHSDYATILARHNALVEAVRKMLDAYRRAEECSCPYCLEDFEKARAEVDRLIANESATDCEGEG